LKRKIQSLYQRRKAISPVIATILLIALAVTAAAIVYFLVVPMFNKTSFSATIITINDSNKDSLYDEISVQVVNSGTRKVNITNIIIWTVPEGEIGNQESYTQHDDWFLDEPSESAVQPSDIKNIDISGIDDQIALTFLRNTYYRLEIFYSGSENSYITDWALLNDQVDFSDLISDFESFELPADGFTGTIDDPGRVANNYKTSGGDYSLVEDEYNYLPVLNESELIPFFITGNVVVFHSTNGNLTEQPLKQYINRTLNPIRMQKFFLLGLSGSWGDNFGTNDWALKVTFTYTDDSETTIELGHDYVDDWWYGANPGGQCTIDPDKATEIDLGNQIDTPHSHIHTHTTRFYIDYFKYLKMITFEDPGDDQSGPHLLSLTAG
jgi:flagellin-like protein